MNGGRARQLKCTVTVTQAYANLQDARRRVGAFIEQVYNPDRLHSALGRQSPGAFEAALRKTADPNRQPLTALSPN